MASLASINIRFAVDLKQFSTEMQNSLRTIDKVGQKFQAVGRNMSAYVTLPILAAGAAAVKFASDYNESLNKVDVSFKSSSVQVKEFAKTSLESFGIAEGTALDMAAAYGDMGTSMGLTTGEAAKMSTSLVGLAGDLASFKNISIDIANTAISAIFTGETESLKKLGIVMTEVNLKHFALNSGIKKNYEQMSQAEKVQLRYNYILSVTKNSQGDFARTQGGAANQMRIFQESLKQVGAQLGAVILPLFTKLISVVNEKIKAFSNLSEGTKKTIVVIAGLVAVIGPLALAIGSILAVIPFVVAGFTLISASILPILAGMTLLLGAVLILKNAFSETAKASVQLTQSQKLIQAVTDEATASIVDQKAQLETLLLTARNENESKKNRLEATRAINKISPQYLGNLTLENINTDKARVTLEKYNKALIAGATARAASRLLEQNQTDKIKAGFEREKALADYNAKRETAISKGWEAEKAFYEENNRLLQFANEALDRKNAKYDREAKLLTEIYNKNKQNIDLVKGAPTAIDVVAPGKTKKAIAVKKAPSNLTRPQVSTEVDFVPQYLNINYYEQQISRYKELQNEFGTATEEGRAKYQTYADAIKDTELIIQDIQGADKIPVVTAVVNELSDAQLRLAEVGSLIGQSVSETFSGLTDSLIGSFGLAKSGFEGFIGGLLQTVSKLIAMMLASSISQSIAGATASGVATGPAAIFTTPAFIATAVGGVLAAFAAIPKFATGGIVSGGSMYGDQILARVNSGEMIANSEQQKRIWGAMNSSNNVNVVLGGGFEIDGNKLKLVLDRTDNRNSRTR